MSLINIRTEIKAIIDSIAAANNIANVYNYPVTQVGSTPAVVILDGSCNEEYADTANNQLNSRWVIRVIVEKMETQANDSTVVTTLLTIVDAVMAELRKASNESLNCKSHSVLIEEVTPTEAGLTGDIPIFYKEIHLLVQSFKTIS